MKIQIDTDRKTVKVLEDINLFTLVKALKVLLGENYNEYTLETNTNITYTWGTYPVITYLYNTGGTCLSSTSSITSGVYNVELQESN